jgi:hypothetical protein
MLMREKDQPPATFGIGLTVRELMTLLQHEDPGAPVIKFHPKGKVTASRVLGFSIVPISTNSQVIQAVMLD